MLIATKQCADIMTTWLALFDVEGGCLCQAVCVHHRWTPTGMRVAVPAWPLAVCAHRSVWAFGRRSNCNHPDEAIGGREREGGIGGYVTIPPGCCATDFRKQRRRDPTSARARHSQLLFMKAAANRSACLVDIDTSSAMWGRNRHALALPRPVQRCREGDTTVEGVAILQVPHIH